MIVSWNSQYDQIFKFIVCYKNLLFVLKFIKGKTQDRIGGVVWKQEQMRDTFFLFRQRVVFLKTVILVCSGLESTIVLPTKHETEDIFSSSRWTSWSRSTRRRKPRLRPPRRTRRRSSRTIVILLPSFPLLSPPFVQLIIIIFTYEKLSAFYY